MTTVGQQWSYLEVWSGNIRVISTVSNISRKSHQAALNKHCKLLTTAGWGGTCLFLFPHARLFLKILSISCHFTNWDKKKSVVYKYSLQTKMTLPFLISKEYHIILSVDCSVGFKSSTTLFIFGCAKVHQLSIAKFPIA